MKTKLILIILTFFMHTHSSQALEFHDPTEDEPFLPWAWEKHLSPTINNAFDNEGITIIGAGIAASMLASNYDDRVRNYRNQHRLGMDEKAAEQISFLASGAVGLAIIGTQMFVDQQNGLKFARAHLLANASHYTLAVLIGKERPRKGFDRLFNTSFPSGHTTTAFVTAGSLAYAYGPAVGVPAYSLATLVAISRIQLERHWVGDVVGGAFLGTFWARASFDQEKDETAMWMPVPVNDGMMVVYRMAWE